MGETILCDKTRGAPLSRFYAAIREDGPQNDQAMQYHPGANHGSRYSLAALRLAAPAREMDARCRLPEAHRSRSNPIVTTILVLYLSSSGRRNIIHRTSRLAYRLYIDLPTGGHRNDAFIWGGGFTSMPSLASLPDYQSRSLTCSTGYRAVTETGVSLATCPRAGAVSKTRLDWLATCAPCSSRRQPRFHCQGCVPVGVGALVPAGRRSLSLHGEVEW